MSGIRALGSRLYKGEAAFGFVPHRRRWYAASALLLLISALALGIRGLDFDVEFTGGTVMKFQSAQATQTAVKQTTQSTVNVGDVTVQEVGGNSWRVETGSLDTEQINQLQSALAQEFVQNNEVSVEDVGPTWGQQISQKALLGLGVFLVLVIIYLSIAFEWKMAATAIIALLHDLGVTAGIYALVGFAVSPATVIGILTILGYSLYDTVIIFDKVRENTAGLLGGSRLTYSQAANRSINQVLMRSINTSVIVLMPVGGILFVGAGLLGAGTLKDLALVLFIGIIAGAYSSIFIAGPLLTDLKEREPQMQALARRVAARQQGGKSATGKSRASDDESQEGEPDTGTPAPAGVGAGPTRSVVEDGTRQQPRRSGSKRRPSGKKRR